MKSRRIQNNMPKDIYKNVQNSLVHNRQALEIPHACPEHNEKINCYVFI